MKPINVEKFQRLLIRKWRKAHDKRVADIRAADSAPAVCEWTRHYKHTEYGSQWRVKCDGTLKYEYGPNCTACERPIKFTEAK